MLPTIVKTYVRKPIERNLANNKPFKATCCDHEGTIVSINLKVLSLPRFFDYETDNEAERLNLGKWRTSRSTLQIKLTQLERTENKTSDVLNAGKQTPISRHLTNLKELLTDVNNARRALEAQKIAEKLSEEEISEWNDVIDAKIEKADGQIESLEESLAKRKTEAEIQEREEKMQFEIKLHETRMKLQEELKTENQSTSTGTHVSQAKLPKLVITKFNGTFADWPRFWGQYSETVDKTTVPP